jgi:hypothetical protein
MTVFWVMEGQVRNNTMKERPVHDFEGTFYSYVDTEPPDYTVPQHIRPQYKTTSNSFSERQTRIHS